MPTRTDMSYVFRSVVLFVLPVATACADPGSERPAVDVPAVPAAQAAVWTQSIDPCTLLTRAEVEGVVGRAVQDPQPNPGNAALCDFRLGDDGVVGITTQDLTMDHTPERMMAELQQRNIQVTETSGIGDRSFFARHGYGMTALNTFAGRRCIILTVFIADTSEAVQEAVAVQLMGTALSRL
jgi:hypothetical protein